MFATSPHSSARDICWVKELADRLGFFPNANVALVNVRPEIRALLSLDDVQLFERASVPLDVVIYCSDELANVKRRVPVLSGFVRSGGRMWVGHPLPGSALATDVGSGDVADIGKGAGLERQDSIDLGDWRLVGFVKL
jgi:hypothetical protein